MTIIKKSPRRRHAMAAVLADPRWKILATGRASPEEIAELRVWAQENEVAAEAWEACRPGSKHEVEQLADTLFQRLSASKSTSATSANAGVDLPFEADWEDHSRDQTAGGSVVSKTAPFDVPQIESERTRADSMRRLKDELFSDSTKNGYFVCCHDPPEIIEVNDRALLLVTEYCSARNAPPNSSAILEQFVAHAVDRQRAGQNWSITHKDELRLLQVRVHFLPHKIQQYPHDLLLISLEEVDLSRVTVADFTRLTPREREIIRPIIEDGLSYKEVACRLHLQAGTVRKHLENIFRKLGVRSLSELAQAKRMECKSSPLSVDSPHDVSEEQQRLLNALMHSEGNQIQAARMLDMAHRTLVNRLKKFEMDAGNAKPTANGSRAAKTPNSRQTKDPHRR